MKHSLFCKYRICDKFGTRLLNNSTVSTYSTFNTSPTTINLLRIGGWILDKIAWKTDEILYFYRVMLAQSAVMRQ